MFKRLVQAGFAFILLMGFKSSGAVQAYSAQFRPPSVPLVVSDPYFSIWSPADSLTDADTIHWTGEPMNLAGLIRIDGVAYRFLGTAPADIPPMRQFSLEVYPTRTIVKFQKAGIDLDVQFTTPRLPSSLEYFSWPLTYINFSVHSTTTKKHSVAIYFDASTNCCVNTPNERVTWNGVSTRGLSTLRAGSFQQSVLGTSGDGVKIDWGYLYASAPRAELLASKVDPEDASLAAFATNGNLMKLADTHQPRPASSNTPALAFSFKTLEVGKPIQKQMLMLAYDERYAINYFNNPLRPYWRRNGTTAPELLEIAWKREAALEARCAAYDANLMHTLDEVGGKRYADIASLAYRQAFGGCGMAADKNGQPLLFTKENTSNGCIATVDVIFPFSPIALLTSPALAKAMLAPGLAYTASKMWIFPFANHDLGVYPDATGQVYGDNPKDIGGMMPVEESGNMILMLDAVAQEEGNPEFASKYWKQVTQWAHFLKKQGFDPGNQLCTDDFTGFLAHNANLSVKAILALGAYGDLCRMRGESATGRQYITLARGMAKKWMHADNDGNHYRIAFNLPNTWSQLYNLAWDRVLNLHIFPPQVAAEEMRYYKTKLNQYGLPLDIRHTYTKTDWSTWTASLATNRSDFESIISRIYDFLNVTPNRTPLSDFYDTVTPHDNGMHARPVVGGLFLPVLDHHAIWMKMAHAGAECSNNWLPIHAPVIKTIVPDAQNALIKWHYTLSKPPASWVNPHFNDSRWKTGTAGFGEGSPGTDVTAHTRWTTDDIWIRRTFVMPKGHFKNLKFSLYHDEDAYIYINGVLSLVQHGYNTAYQIFPIRHEGILALHPGVNTIAVHCHQTTGGQYIDVGIVSVK